MANFDLMCDRGDAHSGKSKREFFSTDTIPLVFSEGSQHLQKIPCNVWLFQLIEIYQGKNNFQHIVQVWNFTKMDKEIWAVCEDLKGNILAFLGLNLFEYHQSFNDVTLYVTEGRCMMKNEYLSSPEILLSA